MQPIESTVEIPIPRAGRKEWMGLAILTLPILLVSMDMTIMYLVIPAISEDLHPGSAQLLWISDIYGFLEAGMLITMGTLGDRIGRRKLLLIGGTCFAIASAVAAFSHTVTLLIVIRGILGIAGACILPATLSLIRNLFHHRDQRTIALGIFTTCFSAGTMLGPLVGGILLDHFGWGSVFLIATPIMLLFLVLAPVHLPEFKDPGSTRLDLWSAFLSLISILLTIYGIKQIAEDGPSLVTISSLVIGTGLGISFIRRQPRIRDPLIDTTLFQSRVFTMTLLAMLLALFIWAGLYLFIAQQLQLIYHMSPLRAGLWTITGAAGGIIGCSTVPWLLRYFTRGQLMPAGLMIMSIGLLGIFFFGKEPGLPWLVVTMIFLSGGCGVAVTVCHDVVMTSARPQQAGAAASLTETFATLGGALGIAVLGSIGTAIYRSDMARLERMNIPESQLETARSTLGGAISVANEISGEVGITIRHMSAAAFADAFTIISGIAALLTIVLPIIIWMKTRKVQIRP